MLKSLRCGGCGSISILPLLSISGVSIEKYEFKCHGLTVSGDLLAGDLSKVFGWKDSDYIECLETDAQSAESVSTTPVAHYYAYRKCPEEVVQSNSYNDENYEYCHVQLTEGGPTGGAF